MHVKLFPYFAVISHVKLLLVFSVTPFRINQNKNQSRSDRLSPESGKRTEGKYEKTLAKIQVTTIFLMKDMRRNFLPKFIDAMLVPTRMGTNMAAGNQQRHLSPSFATKV